MPKSKKRKTAKKRVVDPEFESFKSKKPQFGFRDISPKSSFKPFQSRTGVRGNRV